MGRQGRKEDGEKHFSSGRNWAAGMAAALIASVAVFGLMLKLEKDVLTQYEKGIIYTAAREIPKGQVITQDNCRDYLERKELDKSCIPKTAITDTEQLGELSAAARIEKGVLLTAGMFERLDEITGQLEKPVIAGFKAEDLYQAVGGVLRSGDRIHIYSVEENGETSAVWKTAFVQQVFDGGGTAIPSDDTVTPAQRINIYLEEEQVERFYSDLAAGSLRVVKVCNPAD